MGHAAGQTVDGVVHTTTQTKDSEAVKKNGGLATVLDLPPPFSGGGGTQKRPALHLLHLDLQPTAAHVGGRQGRLTGLLAKSTTEPSLNRTPLKTPFLAMGLKKKMLVRQTGLEDRPPPFGSAGTHRENGQNSHRTRAALSEHVQTYPASTFSSLWHWLSRRMCSMPSTTFPVHSRQTPLRQR